MPPMEAPGLIRLIADFYARVWHRVHVVGEQLPSKVPVIVVGNHTSGVMDGAVVYRWSSRPLRILIKYSILKTPGLGTIARLAGSIPVYRAKDRVPADKNNNEAFSAVRRALTAGEGLLLFPEGESQTACRLRTPLRSGTARMALDAESEHGWQLGLRIVPVGIHYTARDVYRSRVDLRVGKSFSLDGYRQSYADDPRAAVRKLTAEIADRLAGVSLQVYDDNDLPIIDLARRCWHTADGSHHGRLQALASGIQQERERDSEAAEALIERASVLSQHLAEHNVDPIFASTEPPASERTGSALAIIPFTCARLFWGLPARIAAFLARKSGLPDDKIVTGTVLLSLPIGLLYNGLLVGGAWSYLGGAYAGALAAVSLFSLQGSMAASDSVRAYKGRRSAHTAGLADSPSTLPLTREFHAVYAELDRLARQGTADK